MKMIWTHATGDGLPKRACAVALIVGTVLNIINQGDTILSAGSLNWFKLILTYLVPYGVCTYGAVSSQMALAKRIAL
jgi:hypothetical protein